MTHVLTGERIGRTGRVAVGANAIVFSADRGAVLLVQRADNGQWCLPGGFMDPGESIQETAAREVLEESGIRIDVGRLVGVYSDPNRVVEYADGNRYQFVILLFEAVPVGGQLSGSPETLAARYVPLAELDSLEMVHDHRERVRDALRDAPTPVFR